jgi:hypothetical protein
MAAGRDLEKEKKTCFLSRVPYCTECLRLELWVNHPPETRESARIVVLLTVMALTLDSA